jgi:hypothetical protein
MTYKFKTAQILNLMRVELQDGTRIYHRIDTNEVTVTFPFKKFKPIFHEQEKDIKKWPNGYELTFSDTELTAIITAFKKMRKEREK